MIRIGVIGYGYWGPNVVRNFNAVEDAKVTVICDKRPVVISSSEHCGTCPERSISNDLKDVIESPNIDVVAIVTPASTHFELAKAALLNGKHIFVEKPFTQTRAQATELIELAEKKNLQIMVDHTFLYTGAVKKMKQILDAEELGSIYYYDSTRANLGLIQKDANVVWDLAPHDFAVMRYLIKEKPEGIRAFGKSHISNMEDVVYVMVYFANSLIAHFHLNWLSPVKIRTTMIGGEKQMLVWNDMATDEKIKVYDKGVDVKTQEGIYDQLVSYRTGDMRSPKTDQREALAVECASFIECIKTGSAPLSDGKMGLEVVTLLEASEKSLKYNGGLVLL